MLKVFVRMARNMAGGAPMDVFVRVTPLLMSLSAVASGCRGDRSDVHCAMPA